jgi:hypothetical protein
MSAAGQPADDRIVVSVVRSGGIAGIRKTWQAEAADAAGTRWSTLIDDCPWDDEPRAASGADRYVWRIRAQTPDRDCDREVPDSALVGPWRALVDAVRAAQTPSARP